MFSVNGFFRWPGLGPLNPALTDVSCVPSLLLRRLFSLRHGFPLPSRTSEVPGSLALLLLWASQLSSPAQKRVIKAVRADILWFFLTEVAGKPLVPDAVFEGREGFRV